MANAFLSTGSTSHYTSFSGTKGRSDGRKRRKRGVMEVSDEHNGQNNEVKMAVIAI